SKKKVEAARKKNKLVGHYIDEYQNRYEGLKGSKLGDTKQGEVLPPETPSGKPSGEILQGTTIEGEPAGKTTSSGFLGDEEGSISPRLAATMGGAAGGAMLDQKDPLEGALLGAATMHGGARAIEKFGGISIGEKLLNKLRGEEQNSVIKEAEGMVVSSLNDIRARERLAHVTSEKVKTLVPDAMERTKITQAMEHPELVKTLPAKAQQAYHELKKAFTDIGQRATDAQVIKGMLENYITHIVDWKRSPTKVEEALDYFLGTGVGKSAPGKTSSSFGKQRTYETIEDLNKALQGRGLQLKTTDPSEILKLYASSMEKAIAGKNLVTRLKDMVIPEVGKILLPLKKNFLPQGWKTSKSLFLQGYGIHPELAPILEHMFASNDPSAIFRATVALSNFTKRLNVAGSLFHVKSLTEALLSSGFKTFGKELTTGFSGTREALKAFKEGGFGDAADNWIKSGLILETPIDVDRQALGHIAGIVDDLASKAGIKSPLEMGAKWLEQNTLGKFDKLTWDFAHTGFKLLTAEKLLAKAKLDHPSVPETELRKEIVNYVNNSFGGLNWSQIASDSSSQVLRGLITPQGRQGLNILMFAPDWTTATIRAFTSAFGKNSGLKGLVAPRYTADFARQYQARTILLYFTLANGINMAMSGHPIWKNKDKTRVEFKDGTTMQLSKHAMEPYEWMQHPEQTLANKMGFLPHAAIIYWGEKQYPFGPDLEDKSSMGKMKQIMGQGIPFQAQSAMQAPKGEGIQRFISGSLGVPIYGKTEAQKKEDRKRLQQIKRENIKKWKEQNK
ncbi:MAG: hypothetical protein KGL35_13620, partial [Bradyrhizobium sp.]|nr:hypothetical protein [Bradyrhizobium sp.]